jgi:hypothetical protein
VRFSFLGQDIMSGQKKNCLKAVSYSFKDRGSLSKRKDLDVDYVVYKPTTSRSKKSSWVESCADPLYETSVEPSSSSSSSPRKRIREEPAEPPDAEAYQECFSDLFLDTEVCYQPRKTKVCLGVSNSLLTAFSYTI